jgi:hypothetical protein
MNSTIAHAIEQMAEDDPETAVTDKSIYEIYGSWSQHVQPHAIKVDREKRTISFKV